MPRVTPKQTKKFITKHLRDTIDRRKQFAKIKQRHQVKDKRKARKVADAAKASDDDNESDTAASENAKSSSLAPNLKDMSMDDFFQGGFAAAQEPAKGRANRKNAEKQQKPGSQSKLGKRKRDGRTDKDTEDSSSADEQAFEEEEEEEDDDGPAEADQVAQHQDDLSALAEKDPEFYKYLKENDAELLDFAAGGETLVLSDDEDDERPRKKGRVDGSDDEASGPTMLSVSTVKKWAESMDKQHSQAAMREVILAFRAAAHTNEDDEGKVFKYAIPDADTYHEVLITALRGIPLVLAKHLPIKEAASGKVRVPTDSKKYRTFSAMLNSHAISITHLLENLPDSRAVNTVIASLLPILPYFLSFKKTLKNLVKAVINVWADASAAETARVNAFLLLKRLAVISDASLREAVLKSTYQGLVRSAKNTTVHTLPGINLMKNSAADLWGLDAGLGYTTGFTYIRQLAIHLRTSITQPSKENYKAVYNWQYIHSLDFWSRVLSRSCSPAEVMSLKKPADSPLHPLIYPLVQVTLGALRLVPSPTYFPLRFHLTRSLLRLSRTTDTYIPLAPSLLEVLQSPELKKAAKNSTLKPLDFDVIIRAPDAYLHTRVYQDGVAEQLSELAAEFFGVWAKNIAFPELIIPPVTVMKRWLREVSQPGPGKGKGGANKGRGQGNRNGKANAHFSLLVQKLQTNAAFVEGHRRKVDFAVNDRRGVEAFLQDVKFEDTPLGSYVMTIRRQKEERDKMLQESRKEDAERRRGERDTRNGNDEDDASMSGDDGDEDADDASDIDEFEDEDEAEEVEGEDEDEDEDEIESE